VLLHVLLRLFSVLKQKSSNVVPFLESADVLVSSEANRVACPRHESCCTYFLD